MKAAVLLIVGILLSSTLYAGEGNSLLPHWRKVDDGVYTVLHISNVSGTTVTVKVVFFDMQGNVYDEASEVGDNFDTQTFVGDPTTASGGTLSANETGYVYIKAEGVSKRGYGVISWTTTGDERTALIAHANRTGIKVVSGAHENETNIVFPVNQHEPF